MNPTLISVLSAMAAAAWSVWTWQSEQQKSRALKRDEMSAQYVNTFIIATQELQRKLFKILEQDELANYKDRFPADGEPSPVAIDLLYHLGAFFSWGLITFRFGPYTRDSQMIAIMAQIGNVLESRSQFKGEAFRFMLCDRMALGQAAVYRVGETPIGPAFITVSRFRFAQDMADPNSERADLFKCDEVRQTLAAIDRAIAGEALEGRDRLAALQNLLVDLLAYLEKKEGFRLAYGERQRAETDGNTQALASLKSSDVEVVHQIQGRVRLRIRRLRGDAAGAQALQAHLQRLSRVYKVRVNAKTASIVIEYGNGTSQAEFMEQLLMTLRELEATDLSSKIAFNETKTTTLA